MRAAADLEKTKSEGSCSADLSCDDLQPLELVQPVANPSWRPHSQGHDWLHQLSNIDALLLQTVDARLPSVVFVDPAGVWTLLKLAGSGRRLSAGGKPQAERQS